MLSRQKNVYAVQLIYSIYYMLTIQNEKKSVILLRFLNKYMKLIIFSVVYKTDHITKFLIKNSKLT